MFRLRNVIRRATSLTDDELRALWRFRLTLVQLKPTVTPERDFEVFSGDFAWPGWVWILYEQDGAERRVAGFFLQRGTPLTFEGEELLCLLPEYGFLAPHLRGHPVLPLGTVAVTLLSLARHPLRRKYVAASTYPPGYIAFRRAIRPFWTVHEPDLPARERRLLHHLAARVSPTSFRPDDGTVTMRTVPYVDPPGKNADSRRLFSTYEAQNPHWREGRGLFFLFPLSARTLGHVLWHTVERRLNRQGRLRGLRWKPS